MGVTNLSPNQRIHQEYRCLTHYCPTTENHTQCFINGFDWCWLKKSKNNNHNWISTSPQPLPVSTFLSEIVLDILKKKVIPPKTLEPLLNDGDTIKNEIYHQIAQKYANKRKCYGAKTYHSQVYRSVPQINEGPQQHETKLKYFGVEMSTRQRRVLRQLIKRRITSIEQCKKDGNKQQMKKRKWYDKGERITLQDGNKQQMKKRKWYDKGERITLQDG
eukprot:909996_1